MRRLFAIAVTMWLFALSNWARPAVNFSTFFGGYGSEQVVALAVDSHGNIITLGTTDSRSFPLTNSVPFTNETRAGQVNMFIAKFDPTGQRLIFSARMGGDGVETPFALTLDAQDNVYVTGVTTSTNFPADIPIHGTGTYFPFLLKLRADGSEVLVSSTLGAPFGTSTRDVVWAGSGKVWIAGQVWQRDWPKSANHRDIGDLASQDVFLILYDSETRTVERSYRIGGPGDEKIQVRTAIDSEGNVIVAGSTTSNPFPITHRLFKGEGGFLQKYSNAGDLIFSILLPLPSVTSVGADLKGDIWVIAGQTSRLIKIQADGSRILFEKSLPGATINDLKVDSTGRAVLVGAVNDSASFPIATPLQRSFAGGRSDGFVTIISSDGRDILFSTRYGAAGDDVAKAVAVAGDASLIVGGSTSSAPATATKGFPVVNAFQPKFRGDLDAFLTRIDSYTNVPPFLRLTPERNVNGEVVIRVPLEGQGYVLQSITNLTRGEWVDEPISAGGLVLTNRPVERMKFFRLLGAWPR